MGHLRGFRPSSQGERVCRPFASYPMKVTLVSCQVDPCRIQDLGEDVNRVGEVIQASSFEVVAGSSWTNPLEVGPKEAEVWHLSL